MVKIDIDSASIVQLRQELKKVRDELSSLPKDAEGFQAAAAYAGEIKDKMKDVNEQVAIFASGSKFEQAGIALGQVKDNLMNLDFEGAAEKARSLTAIVKTISFGEATKGLTDLGSTFMNLGKALLTNPLFLIPTLIISILGAFGLLGPILDTIKGLFNSLSKAVSEFLDYLGITNTEAERLAKSQKKLREESDKQKTAIAEEGQAYVTLLGQLSQTNKGSEERRELIKDINSQYGTTLTNMEDEAAFQKQVNAEMDNYIEYLIAKYTLQAQEDKIKLNIKNQLSIQEQLNESKRAEKKILEDISGAQKRAADSALDFSQTGKSNYQSAQTDIARLNIELEKQRYNTGLINQSMSNAKQRFKSYIQVTDDLKDSMIKLTDGGKKYNGVIKTTSDTTKDNIEIHQELAKTLEELESTTEKYGLSDIQLAELRYNKLIKEIEAQHKLSTDIDKDEQMKKAKAAAEKIRDKEKQDALNKMYAAEDAQWLKLQELTLSENDFRKLQLQQRFDDEYSAAEGNAELQKALKEKLEKDLNDIDVKATEEKDKLRQEELDKEKAHQRALVDAKLQIASDGLNLISNLTDLFNNGSEESAKKAFNVNKAIGIAQATIQTYQSAQAAYLSQMSVPSPDAPIRASIAAGIAVAAGIANIAKISATQYKGSSPNNTNSFGGNSSTLTAATPMYNLYGSSNNANTVNASTNQPINVNNQVMVKAIVSETDITDAQRRVSRYKTSSEL